MKGMDFLILPAMRITQRLHGDSWHYAVYIHSFSYAAMRASISNLGSSGSVITVVVASAGYYGARSQ
jgi:aspartate aminotransferase-like enzyme